MGRHVEALYNLSTLRRQLDADLLFLFCYFSEAQILLACSVAVWFAIWKGKQMSIYRRILHTFALCLALASPHVKADPLLFAEILPTAPLFTNLDPTYWTQTVVAPNQWAFTKASPFLSTFAPLGVVPTYSLAWLEPDGSTNFNVLVVGADNDFFLVLSDVPLAVLPALPLFIPPAVLDSEFLGLVVPIFDPGFAQGNFFDTVAFVDFATAAELIEPPSLALVGLALVAIAGIHGRRRRRDFQHPAKA